MKLDYIPNINRYGDDLLRLYEFDSVQAQLFSRAIEQTILADKRELAIKSLNFIEPRNCTLVMRLAAEDEGIISENKINFFCALTLEGYKKMVFLLAPFCKKETKGYQYLYEDIDNPTDFLFSPAGTW